MVRTGSEIISPHRRVRVRSTATIPLYNILRQLTCIIGLDQLAHPPHVDLQVVEDTVEQLNRVFQRDVPI